MSALGNTNPTLLDFRKRTDPSGRIDQIIEILNETNEIIQDATFVEGNLPTGHLTTVRSGLPTPTWRLLNYGVQPSKSRTVQVTDSCGMLEAYSEVDAKLVSLAGNPADFRFTEDSAHLEAMSQEFANTLIYGNTNTDPEKFMGLAPRFNDLTNAQNKDNIISGAGTGSTNTSIWLVIWGPSTAHGIFPKGSNAGLQMKDKGLVTIENASNDTNFAGRMEAYRTHFSWDCGFTLRDWRYVVRIANVDVTTLTKNAATGADIISLMTQAMELVPSLTRGRPVFYCNRTVKSWLRQQIASRVAANLTLDTVSGKPVMAFDGVPVRRVDALLNTESKVS